MSHRFGSAVVATLALLAALAGLGSPAWAEKAKPNLGEARQLLAGVAEGAVKRGTEICVKANSVASVKLLLEVLRRKERLAGRALAPGHYRDIVWDGLLKITDPYARAVVAKLARKDRNPWVRQWAVELIGIWGDREFAEYAVKACQDRHRQVRRWAARSLGLLRHNEPNAVAALLKLTRDKSPYVRANATEALAQFDAKKQETLFFRTMKEDPDGGVRCALLGAMRAIYPKDTTPHSIAALQDADWRPRMQAVDNLAIATKESVDGLVVAAKDGRPAVAERAMTYLRKLTEKEIYDADGWSSWWNANRDKFKFPKPTEEDAKEPKEDDAEKPKTDGDKGKEAEKPKELKKRETPKKRKTVAFNEIPLASDHVAFMIDKSIMMNARLKSKKMAKYAAALEALDAVLGKLHGRLMFNVFCYRDEVSTYKKKPVALDEKHHKRALAFVRKEKNQNAKDIWQVLEMVVADPEIDTGYLLSSGEPDIGLYVHWNRVTRHLHDLNRFHKVTIHTVVYSGRKWYRDQLEKIAQTTHGEFKWFE